MPDSAKSGMPKVAGLGDRLQKHFLVDLAQGHLDVLDGNSGFLGPLVCNRLHVAERAGGIHYGQRDGTSGRQLLGRLGRLGVNVVQRCRACPARPHDERRRKRQCPCGHRRILQKPAPALGGSMHLFRHMTPPLIFLLVSLDCVA
jgi:hypothetical protein